MSRLDEGLRAKDLMYLVGNKIHFDEYESKMGKPEDVITVSFKVKQRMPAQDLTSFIENGYDWVLDADVSSGEIDDGEYLVFVELPRRPKVFEQINELLEDLAHLTDIKSNDWQFKWYKQKDYFPLSETDINEIVPTSSARYLEFMEQFEQVREEQMKLETSLEEIKRLSGIK